MKSFRLLNIKSFQDTGEILLKPITVFVGKNSSGKSSVIRFPVLLSQTFLEETISPMIFNGKYVDYGNFEDVVHNHSGNSLEFTLKFETEDFKQFGRTRFLRLLSPKVLSNILYKTANELTLTIKLNKVEEKIVVEQCQASIEEKLIFSLKRKKVNYEFMLYVKLIDERLLELEESIVFPLLRPKFDNLLLSFDLLYGREMDRSFEIFKELVKEKFDYEAEDSSFTELVNATALGRNIGNGKLKQELSSQEESIVAYLDSIIDGLFFVEQITDMLRSYMNNFAQKLNYIGPFRTSPERIYRTSESLHKYVGREGEYSSMLLRQAHKDKNPLFERVSSWFSKAMGYTIGIEDIPDSSLFRVKVFSEQSPKGDNLIDVGFGISQILPIVIQLYYDKSQNSNYRKYPDKLFPEVFVFEQPEIHLHPNAQAELANLFVEKTLETSRRKSAQILIETHSEHLIRRLQSIVADPDNPLTSDDIAIYYVDMQKNGNSYVTKMELTENGQFVEKWPSGFFDKSYLLSRELSKNISKRVSI